MRNLPIVHHCDYSAQIPGAHRFPMQKFARLAEILVNDGLVPCGFTLPTPISRDQLLLAHTPRYVDAILGQTLSPQEIRKLGFPLTSSVVRRAQLATGGTLLAARLALVHGLASNTAGGSHHAMPDHGAGFCVFNDVAVAASVLLQERPDLKIMIVDLDVHHGDGTAAMFAREPRVFTYSMHCEANWPTIKPASDHDTALASGVGDDAYLRLLADTLPTLLDEFVPDLVFYNAGVDPHMDDRLGKLCLSDAGLTARERYVVETVRGRNVPLATVLGGGYCTDMDALGNRHALMFHACADWLAEGGKRSTDDAPLL